MLIEKKNTIYITGSSGFVGNNLLKYLDNFYTVSKHQKGVPINFNQDIVIHLAGKAHDIKNVSDSSEYYSVNTELTKSIFDKFLDSNASVFITLSSVKAVSDEIDTPLTEEHMPNPITHYGMSKFLAEEYILSKNIPNDKRVYILRPCMIHGPGNKGNLNLLYNLVSKGFPWPLGLFENSRSYLSLENLCFIIKELLEREDIPSGVYNVADDVPLSTNEVIIMIAESKGKKASIMNLNKNFIKALARAGDFLKLPLNSDRLQKLTDNYVVNNLKIKKALKIDYLPISSKAGLQKTFNSF